METASQRSPHIANSMELKTAITVSLTAGEINWTGEPTQANTTLTLNQLVAVLWKRMVGLCGLLHKRSSAIHIYIYMFHKVHSDKFQNQFICFTPGEEFAMRELSRLLKHDYCIGRV
jgi:hypothetical protein